MFIQRLYSSGPSNLKPFLEDLINALVQTQHDSVVNSRQYHVNETFVDD